MRKKITAVVLSLVLMLCASVVPAIAADSIKITIDGQAQTYDQMPVMVNDRVLVPMRGIFEALGATIAWEEATETVTGTLGSTTVTLKIGDTKATVNGSTVTLDVPAQLVNDRTLVPVRFISESLGAEVEWVESSQTVVITTQKEEPNPDDNQSTTPTGTTKSFTFEDWTQIVDKQNVVLGAEYKPENVSVSSEQDHTTGSGKSLKMANRTKSDHRVKLPNVFSESDIGKTFTISAWVYVPNMDKGVVTLATYSDVGLTYAFNPKRFITVSIPQATWTEIKMEYKHEDALVTQVGFDQRPASNTCIDTIYVDDVTVVEGANGNSEAVVSGTSDGTTITTTENGGNTGGNTGTTTPPATGGSSGIVKNSKGTIDSLNFDSLTALVENTDMQMGGGLPAANVIISSEQDHTSGSGKSLKMGDRTESYFRLKLMNFFAEADVGKTYTVKCWVYSPIDTKVRLGAYSLTNTDYAMTPFASESFDVKKDTWTELTFEYEHEDKIVSLFGIDQPNGSELAPTLYMDDITVSVK